MNDSLTALALLGTSRHTALPPAPHQLLQSSWQQLSERDLSSALLQAAALEATLHRSGHEPLTNVAIPSPASEEQRPSLVLKSVQAVERMLNGEYAQGLTEWFELAAESDHVAPARILPRLLEHGTRHSRTRVALQKIAGTRGTWLAQRNERWSWLLEEQAVENEAWETGTSAERLAWLQQVRETDPSRAAEALAAQWKSESPDQRERFTTLVASSPKPRDADWLEELALKDRRQGTRRAAVSALMQLPESAFHQRSLTRASALLSLQRKTLSLNPPEAFDAAWAQDNIQEKPSGKIGKRAWWSRQILAQVPLNKWPDQLGVGPEKLFDLKLDPDWASTILQAWIDSALTYPQAAQLDTFLPFLTKHPSFADLRHPSTVLFDLLRPLDRAQAADLLERLTLDTVDRLQLLVRLQPLVHPKRHAQLSRALRDWWKNDHLTVTRPEATSLAFCPSLDSIKELIRTIGKLPSISSATETFARTLEFRQSYL